MAVVLGLAVLLSCSKKATPPTSPDPVCSLSADTLAFEVVTVGGSLEQSLTVTNSGGGTLAGTASTSSAGYSIVSGASFSLGAGQQATVTVRFTPPGIGTYPGGVGLLGTDCPGITCSASGQASGPVCQLSDGFLNFNPIAGVCAYTDRSFTITNIGTGILSGTVASPCGTFQILGDASYSLAPGERDTVTLRFSPGGYGDYSCEITTGCHSVFCSGSIVRHDICGRVAPDVLDFGTVYVGQTVRMSATLTAGAMPFDLIWAWQSDPNFDSPSGAHVEQNDTFSCVVDFMPQTAGTHSAWFAGQCLQRFGGDGDYHPFACITARGTAVVAPGTPACQLSVTFLNFGTVSVGYFAERTLTVTNAGGGVLNGTAQPSGCPEFVVQQDPMISLGPGQSKSYVIRFTPTQRGVATTCYVFPFDPNCGVVTLSGQGQ